jgi:hypothetical protein
MIWRGFAIGVVIGIAIAYALEAPAIAAMLAWFMR